MAGTSQLLCEATSLRTRVKRTGQLASDTVVTTLMATLHGLTVMCQAIIYAVALNGSRNGLVALLIATQFAEVKGITYRRVDERKLLYTAQQARPPGPPAAARRGAACACTAT